MNMYCIYDNLYEEYQMTFNMKNDNIAKIEFEMFVNAQIEKAPEKEKPKTKTRFILCKFNGIEYKPEIGTICIESPTAGRIYELHADPIIIGENNNE